MCGLRCRQGIEDGAISSPTAPSSASRVSRDYIVGKSAEEIFTRYAVIVVKADAARSRRRRAITATNSGRARPNACASNRVIARNEQGDRNS